MQEGAPGLEEAGKVKEDRVEKEDKGTNRGIRGRAKLQRSRTLVQVR